MLAWLAGEGVVRCIDAALFVPDNRNAGQQSTSQGRSRELVKVTATRAAFRPTILSLEQTTTDVDIYIYLHVNDTLTILP